VSSQRSRSVCVKAVSCCLPCTAGLSPLGAEHRLSYAEACVTCWCLCRLSRAAEHVVRRDLQKSLDAQELAGRGLRWVLETTCWGLSWSLSGALWTACLPGKLTPCWYSMLSSELGRLQVCSLR